MLCVLAALALFPPAPPAPPAPPGAPPCPQAPLPLLESRGEPVAGGAWTLEVRLPGGSSLALLVVTAEDRGGGPRLLACEPVRAGGPLAVALPVAPALEGLVLRAVLVGRRDGVLLASAPVTGVVAARGGDGLPDELAIVSCSLGCAGDRTSLACGTAAIHVNEELRLSFSQAIDLASVGAGSFSFLELSTGTVPAGAVWIDPADPTVLVYQPAISFDASGNPTFGLEPDAAYRLLVPGADLDPAAPHVRSQRGLESRTRLDCVLVASEGIEDVVPGPPSAVVLVDLVTCTLPGAPDCLAVGRPAAGATNASPASDVTVRFGDLMNPATLLNPVTGISIGVAVRVDPDGNLADPSDQLDVAGAWSLVIDQIGKQTLVVLHPDAPLPARTGPSSGGPTVVVELSSAIEDLVGNALANPGQVAFTVAP